MLSNRYLTQFKILSLSFWMKLSYDHSFIHSFIYLHCSCAVFSRGTVCFSNYFRHPDKNTIRAKREISATLISMGKRNNRDLRKIWLISCHWECVSILVLVPARILLICGKCFANSYFEFGTKRVKNRTKNSLTKNVFTGSKHKLVSTRNALTSSCFYKTETSHRELPVLIEQYETPSEFWYYNALPSF